MLSSLNSVEYSNDYWHQRGQFWGKMSWRLVWGRSGERKTALPTEDLWKSSFPSSLPLAYAHTRMWNSSHTSQQQFSSRCAEVKKFQGPFWVGVLIQRPDFWRQSELNAIHEGYSCQLTHCLGTQHQHPLHLCVHWQYFCLPRFWFLPLRQLLHFHVFLTWERERTGWGSAPGLQ